MDCSISPNYQNISFSFRLKFWEVSSAIHISSGIEVSIWKFIYSDINSQYSEAETFSFISKYRNSLVASQHIHHCNILRIFEISSEEDPLSFSSERITSSFSQEKNITNDEAYFMISQLCTALHYLHNDFHVAYFSISPNNIFFSPRFNLKLANLVHFGKFTDFDSIIEPNLYPLNSSIFDIDPRFASPEIKDNQPLTSYSDVYSFALFLIYVFTNEIPKKFPINVSKLNIPDDLKPLVEQCLSKQANKRPTIEQISQSPPLNPVTVRVLNFIPKINESSFEIRKNFFEKLSGIISNYSPRFLSLKFVPTITKEITEDKELTQQLLPILLMASEKINSLDTYNLILQPIFKIEQCADYFFEKALTMTDASVFVPILIFSYKSHFKSISSRRHELLKSINALENVNSIICLIDNFDNEDYISLILQVLEGKVELSNSTLFIRQLKHLYKKFNSITSVCKSISSALMTIQPNTEYAAKAVSLSFDLTKSSIKKKEKEKLIQFAEKFLVLVRESIENEHEETKHKINGSKSSNQILSLNYVDDDVENLSPRKVKKEKKHKEKKDKKNRRSSLSTSSSLRKLQMESSRNNSFSNSQKLFQLPRGINPLSLKNPFINEIDQFSFREYINAEYPPFSIKDSDPFEIISERRRRMSEISVDSASSSNEEIKDTSSEKSGTQNSTEDKNYRRSMSSQSLSRFPNQNDSNQHNPFSAQNTSNKFSLSQFGSIDMKSDSGISDDDSGPFKVSNTNSAFSSVNNTGFSAALKNYSESLGRSSSTKISNFSLDMLITNDDDGKSSSPIATDAINAQNESSQNLNQIKPKTKRPKSRPYIPTPPKKLKKAYDEQ